MAECVIVKSPDTQSISNLQGRVSTIESNLRHYMSVTMPKSTGEGSKDVSGVTGLTTSDHPIVSINITSASTVDACYSDWGKMYRVTVPSNGTIRFHFTAATAADRSVSVVW